MTDTLCSRFWDQVADRPGDAPALAMPGHPGLTWAGYAEQVRRLAPGLAGLGVGPGDKVALLMGPRPEFHVVDTAVLHARAVPFSLALGETAEQMAYQLRLTEARVLVAEAGQRERAHELVAATDGALRVVVVDAEPEDGELGLPDVAAAAPIARTAEAMASEVVAEDIATIIFTSGTTGEPKAVQLSHRAIVVSEDSTFRLAPSRPGGQALCYLPLNHIAERFMSHYASLAHGVTVHSVPDPDLLYDEIVRVRPTRFFGVPRVYEKLVARVREAVAADPALTEAYAASLQDVREEQDRRRAGEQPRPEPGPEATGPFAALRAELGLDRAEYLGVATAPSSYDMLECLLAVGLRVSDIWGMSEIIMCTLNPPDAIRLGTVGRLLDGVEARIAPDGEILVRGPNAFSGYLGDDARTAETIDADGWVRTGDVGELGDGYLTIRGRKKELLITATGKNIAPAKLEAAIKDESSLVDQVMAIGDGRRYVTAIVALDPEAARRYAERHGLPTDVAALAASDEARREVGAAIERANQRLSRPERVRGFWIADVPWPPGSDEVTATAKLRRDRILTKYTSQIEELYR